MDLLLGGKVAVVTGGSEGIGRAAAHSLGREGARVVICARRGPLLEQVAHELSKELAAEILPIVADVSQPAELERVIDAAVTRFGRLDILVNNAGTSRAMAFEEVTDQSWMEDLNLKLFAAIRASRQAIGHLRRSGGGSILNLLNIAAKQPSAASTPTSVSRAAGMALTKALSKELGKDNVRVNALLIGLVKSGQHQRRWRAAGGPGTLDEFYAEMADDRAIPLGRVAEAAEAGDLFAFLCSPRAAYLSGVALNFDGGTSAVV